MNISNQEVRSGGNLPLGEVTVPRTGNLRWKLSRSVPLSPFRCPRKRYSCGSFGSVAPARPPQLWWLLLSGSPDPDYLDIPTGTPSSRGNRHFCAGIRGRAPPPRQVSASRPTIVGYSCPGEAQACGPSYGSAPGYPGSHRVSAPGLPPDGCIPGSHEALNYTDRPDSAVICSPTPVNS